MGKVKELVATFKKENSGSSQYTDQVIDKLIYPNGSLESDFRALLRKAALLRKRGAEYHSLIKNPKEYKEKIHIITEELTHLNNFIQFAVEKIPSGMVEVRDAISQNNIFLKRHSSH